ncbi:phage antirepressor protein [Pseudomonas capeferrum]|uniref:phage antirepressor KilAC domain-containing protein n=1 Tax=Pseudomonas capeferrum TaxID=1495066 RepID=UPI0015E28A52|nr:phage antirepressor KilAC domain-containing protein [Pseudomonas capeferrum]MBA1200486.1 phage antirepressor protein [Pseudomonas capeferrum]
MHRAVDAINTQVGAPALSGSPALAGQVMSSREIADLTGKRHDNVKADIRSLLAELKRDVLTFQGIYLDGMNRQQTEYLLDREHTDCLLTGYSAGMRMAVIKRWRELEEGNGRVIATLPDFSSPAVAARAWAEQYERQQAASQALAIAAPKAAFVDQYVQASGSMSFRQVAKLLKANERQFRQMLLDKGVMYYLGGVLTPCSQHQAAKRFELKTGTSDTNGHAYAQARFTAKGVQWVAGVWASYQLEQSN